MEVEKAQALPPNRPGIALLLPAPKSWVTGQNLTLSEPQLPLRENNIPTAQGTVAFCGRRQSVY